MGFIKELKIEGINYTGNKYVCDKCFGDYALQEYIRENAVSDTCDYCGRSSDDNEIAAQLHEVVGFILQGIRYEWDEPVNCVGWCSQEGGWVGVSVIDTHDLFADELELDIQHDSLFSDIIDSIDIYEWCQGDPYSLPPGEEMFYDWKEFADQIKHRIRYVFFRVLRRDRRDVFDKRQPHVILNKLGELVNELGLINSLLAGTEFIRARISEKKLRPTVKELGPPPLHKAIYSNRMSPAGIPMFYGSIDEKTAIAETYDKKDKKKRYVTVAAFRTMKDFKILDLTQLPDFPSLFDERKRHLRAPLIFLRSFLADFSKPIKKDGQEHIEYVPTQVVTEYFRHIFRDGSRDVVRGILYPSARRKTGKSCVLFFEDKDCFQANIANEDEDKKWLCMYSSSVKVIKLK